MAATAAVSHGKLGRVFNSPRAADRIGTLADFLPRDKGVQVRALPPFNGGSSTRVKNDSSAEDQDDQEGYMSMTSEQREQVATELKRFAGDLNLTEQQKDKLHTALAEEREKVGEYLKAHPNTTKAEIVTYVKEHRAEIHQRVAAFLSPEQLSKWDSEVAKAKEFLGQRLDS